MKQQSFFVKRSLRLYLNGIVFKSTENIQTKIG